MATPAIAVERQGPVGLVTLDRPERHNAFDDSLIEEEESRLGR